MNKIQELSGQEYVEMYASEAKLLLLKEKREAMKEAKKSAPVKKRTTKKKP